MKRIPLCFKLILPVLLLYPVLFTNASAVLSSPAFYLATDKSFGPGEQPYVNMEGPGERIYEFRIYKIKSPLGFFKDAVKERLVTEDNTEVFSNPVSITMNTWRAFKSDIRAIARREFKSRVREKAVKSFNVNFDDLSVKDPESAPGYLRNHEMIGSFSFPVKGTSWEYRRVPVPVDSNGVFLIEAVQGKNIGYTVIVKSNLNFVTKQSDNETLIFTARKDTGRPVAEASVSILSENGDTLFSAMTHKDGTLLYNKKTPAKTLIVIKSDDNEFAISDPSYFSSSFYGSGGIRTFLYTERPVYRPGDRVFFKGIVRDFKKDSYNTVSGSGKVEIFNPKNEKTGEDIYVTVSGNGTFSGLADLPSEEYTSLGTYRIVFSFAGEKFSSEFGVDAYRKPAYLVKVTTPKPAYSKKDTIPVTINARYHYGEPVSEARVTYRVFRRAKYDYSPVGALPFFEEASEYLGLQGSSGANELVLEKTGELNNEGNLEFEIKPENIDRDYTYSIMASVTSSDSAIDGSGSFSVNRSAFFIRVARESSVFSPGEAVKIKAELIPFDRTLGKAAKEKLISGRKIKVHILKRTFVMISREAKREEVELKTKSTDINGTADFSFELEKGGHYIAYFEADDPYGDETTAESPFWVSARNDSIQLASRTLSVSSSKDIYSPGEEADILIVSPVADGTVLLTIEGNYIYKYEAINIEGNSLRYKIKISDRLSPNFNVSVTQFANNEIFRNSIRIVAPPLNKFLQVKIKPKKEIFTPGRQAELFLETMTRENRPVSAEVSVSVVDEAVYQIQENRNPSINVYFYHPRQNNVLTTYSAAYRYFGYSEEKRLQLAFGNRVLPPLAVLKEEVKRDRERFKDTAFWSADVRTGSDGKGKIAFRLPDNITSWRVIAIAITKDTKVGQAKKNFIAKKDLMVMPGVPVVMLKGEKQAISANVSNLTQKKLDVNITAAVSGGTISGSAKSKVSLDRGKSGHSYFEVIPDNTDENKECVITLSAASGSLSDSVKLRIPLKAPGIARSESARMILTKEDEASATIELPEKIKEARLSLFVTPGTGAALRQSLEYLAGYPYGCIEQTMSRFFPLLAAKQAGYITPWINAKLPDMTHRGIERIKANQRSDGGFGWFGDGDADPMMSAYVLWGLSASEKLFGRSEDSASIKSRLISYLRKIYKEGHSLSRFEKNFIMFSLAESGSLPRSLMANIIKDSEDSGPYSKALAVLILERSGKRNEASKYLAKIIDENKWASDPDYIFSPGEYGKWENDRIETTSMLLTGAVRLGASSKLTDTLESILVNNRRDIAWKNSRDTAMAVMALSESLRSRTVKEGNLVFSLSVNSKEAGEFSVKPAEIESGNMKIDIPGTVLKEGKNTISLRKESGSAVVFARADFFDLSPSFKESSSGIHLEKRLYRMEGSGSEGNMTFSAKKTDEFSSGDLVMIEIEAETAKEGENYLIVEDCLAPGFRPVSDDSLYFSKEYPKLYLTRESYDDKVVLFASNFGNKTIFRYFVRAELPGKYRILPATASQMYYPQVTGSTSDSNIEIVK